VVFSLPGCVAWNDITSVIRAIDAPGGRAGRKTQLFRLIHTRAADVAVALHDV
jgi:hypothetical protein